MKPEIETHTLTKMKTHILLLSAGLSALLVSLASAAEPVASGSPQGVAAPQMPSVRVAVWLKSRNPAIELAGAELCRYLGLMAGNSEVAAVTEHPPKGTSTIELGLMSDFGLPMEGVRDPARDDVVHADVRGSKGVIAGSNPRSVLFATYRFLEACGCRWIRPGKDGDFVPTRAVDNLAAHFTDRATYRFRGNNNCGTYSLDQMLDKIEWASKVGLNTFFHEFLLPRDLYNTYYKRNYPSLKNPEPRSDEEIRAYHELSIREIKRRGMFYHAAGHGWTSVVLGLPESESDHGARPAVPPGKERFLALVKGKRDLSRGPTFTDLCYGNPEVRQRIVQCVADYATRHPEVDYLHFWTDDAMNMTCECPLCRDTRLSDLYVEILNGIDAELSRRNNPIKIVFLIYQDLIWPPEKQRLNNPQRFVEMFAPISRRYDKPYDLTATGDDLPPYRLNQNQRPTDEHASMTVLRSWQKVFQGEAFVFDYHMTWHHYRDPGYCGFTKVMAEDIRRLPKMGMDGFVSCQVLRSYFPHGYPMYLHARMLWNPAASTDKLAREYFAGAFGDGSEQVRRYMTTLSDLFAPLYLDRDMLFVKDEAARQAALAKLAKVSQTVADFQPIIASHSSTGNPAHQQSWKLLSLHADMTLKLAAAVQAKAEKKQKEADALWKQLVEQVAVHEAETDAALDIAWFLRAYPGWGGRLFAPVPTQVKPAQAAR